MKPFNLGGHFASGFSMALMAKDIGIAAELSRKLHAEAEGICGASLLWNKASRSLGPIADLAAICKHLSENVFRSKEQTAGGG
jgi:3-hydroxyisobutyrate dehydrogenase